MEIRKRGHQISACIAPKNIAQNSYEDDVDRRCNSYTHFIPFLS